MVELGGVVVAHQGEHAAMSRGPGEIGVAEHVAAAIDARTLAVPDREHAVVATFAAHLGLLRAPDGGGRQILVEARLEDDVLRGKLGPHAEELLVEPPSGEPR